MLNKSSTPASQALSLFHVLILITMVLPQPNSPFASSSLVQTSTTSSSLDIDTSTNTPSSSSSSILEPLTEQTASLPPVHLTEQTSSLPPVHLTEQTASLPLSIIDDHISRLYIRTTGSSDARHLEHGETDKTSLETNPNQDAGSVFVPHASRSPSPPPHISTSRPSSPPVHFTESAVLYDGPITIIENYISSIDSHSAESSTARHPKEDEVFVIVDEGGPSEDPAKQEPERLKALLKTTIRKFLPILRKAGSQFQYEFFTHQVLKVCRIGYQINLHIPFFTQYLKQIIEKLPDDDDETGNELAEAIEEIANKLLEIAVAIRGTSSSGTTEEGQ